MKLRPLDPAIEQPTAISGVAVIITHVGRSLNGLPRARVTIWNGRPLAADVVELDRGGDRRRLAKAASAADPVTVPDPGVVEAALLTCAEALHAHAPDPAGSGAEPKEAEGRPSANFPGLVDVVADEDGAPAFLVLDPRAEHGVSVVREHTPADGPDAGATLVPPPARSLPWRLPRASEVLRYLALGWEDGVDLFRDVVRRVKEHALLPAPLPGHPDAYYELCAAWAFHTHLLEAAAYSPIVAFYAVPERGKSRTGRALTYIARRGVHTETLREANLFRDSQDRGATLFLDCRDLWKKAEKLGCDDILLQRFERGARVSRVLNPDRGPFRDTTHYDIFGPTLAATNEPLGRILDTRCVPIGMPLAPGTVEYPVPDEAALLPLRERLTAWRARRLAAGWRPPGMPKPASSRLGDVLLPLAQIVAQVAPDRLAGFLALARHLESERRGERALSWESAVVAALAELEDRASHGLLLVGTLAERVNAGRPDKEQLSNKRIGDVLRSLGLEVRKAHGNKAAAVWDGNKIRALADHYAQPAESVPEQKTAGTHEGAGPAHANDATHANPSEPAAPYSLDSVVGVPRGDADAKVEGFSVAEANPSPVVAAAGGEEARLDDLAYDDADEELPW